MAGALGPDAAARRLLHPADRERPHAGRRPECRRDGRAGHRRRGRPGPGRHGRHRQDPARGRHRGLAVGTAGGGPAGLGDRDQPGRGPDQLRAGAGRRGGGRPVRGPGGGRLALPGLAGRDLPAVAGGARRPHRPGGAGEALALGRQWAGGGHHQPAGHGAAGPQPAGRAGRPVQPPRGPELPVRQAARPAGPADRGARSRHRARLPAHRPGPGRGADRRDAGSTAATTGPGSPTAAPGQPGRGPVLGGRRHRRISA